MKKFILKMCILSLLVFGPVVYANYVVDPGNIFNTKLVNAAAENLLSGNAIESPGDMDEGLLLEKMLRDADHTPKTVIIGSSHIMFIPYEYDDYFVAGLSASFIGDYYATVGLLDSRDELPGKIVFGVDPWVFRSSYEYGSHTSISKYSVLERQKVLGESRKKTKNSVDFKKVKELFSFAYFQISVDRIKKYGVSSLIPGKNGEVVVVSDKDSSDRQKMLPNGGRSFNESAFNTVEQNDIIAQNETYCNTVYMLEDRFDNLNEQNFLQFVELVDYLLSRDVEVEFYLPSWYPITYEYFQETDSFKGVLIVEDRIREIAAQRGLIVRGSYNPSVGGVDKADYADNLHLRSDSALRNYNVIQ